MAKELVVYKQKIKKANMASKSKGIAKGDIWKKASREQKIQAEHSLEQQEELQNGFGDIH